MEIANSKSPFYELVVLANTLTKQAAGLPSGDKARVEAVRDAIVARVNNHAGSDSEKQKALVKKEYFRLFYPQTWEEAEYQLALNGIPAISTDPESETESAEVLYFILTSGKIVGSVKLDDEVISPTCIRDTDGNGRKELIDAWGKAVRFYRWPTRLLKSDGVNISADDKKIANILFPVPTSNESQDPLDPVGIAAISGSAFETDYYLPGVYHSMVIVSAGPDGEFGLEKPGKAASFGKWCKASNPSQVFDNISSRTVNTN